MGAGLWEDGSGDLQGKMEEGRQAAVGKGSAGRGAGEQVVWVIASV